MSQELYAKPAASVKTASYLVRLRGLPPQRLSMTHRALLAFLQQAGQRRAAAVAQEDAWVLCLLKNGQSCGPWRI